MRTRPSIVAVSAAVVIAVVQVAGSFGAAAGQPDRRSIDAFALALVVAGAIAVVWSERFPVAVGVFTAAVVDVYVAAGYAFGPVFLCLAVALFAVVQARGKAIAGLIAGGFLAGFAVALAIDDNTPLPTVAHVALVGGWTVVVIAVSEVVRVRREQAAAARRAAVEEGLRHADELRLRIAQDVHDVLAHNLSMISVQAGVALHLLDDHPDQARPALTTIKAASRDALGELRHALDVLRTGDAAPRGPLPGLGDLAALVDGVRRSGIDVLLDAPDPPTPLPATVGHAVYRVVQESLTNVARHAGARRATVRLRYDDGVTVEVSDDGRGGPYVEGHGIAGMRQRLEAVGGTLRLEAPPGGGLRVVASVPGVLV